jgi:hypothetical protein
MGFHPPVDFYYDINDGVGLPDPEAGAPSGAATSIARELPFVSRECLEAAGISLTQEGIVRLEQKRLEWNTIVVNVNERLATETDDYAEWLQKWNTHVNC